LVLFEAWCKKKGLDPLGVSPVDLALYIAKRFDEGAQAAGTKITAMITALNEAAGKQSPVNNAIVSWTKAGIEKLRKRMPRTEEFPLDALLQWRLHPEWCSSRFEWLRNAAIAALGVRTAQRPNDIALINIEHVKFEKGLLWVTIPSTKVDQEGRGNTIPVDPTGDKNMCVVRIVQEYIKERKGKPHEPLFTHLNSKKRLLAGGIDAVLKKMVEKAGLGNKVSGRSLRVAGASYAAAGGVPKEVIQTVGGWRSDAINYYYRPTTAINLGISQRMGFTTQRSLNVSNIEAFRSIEKK
jgi:integrase